MKKLEKLDAKTIRIGIAGLIALVVIVVIVVSVAGGSSDDNSSSTSGSGAATRESLSESELIAQASELGHPVYWVGSRPGTESYELTNVTNSNGGNVYIRYLTGGAKAGDPRPNFLTIGTYSVPDASKALQKAEKSNSGSNLSKREGYEVLEGKSGTDSYVVFEDEPELQIEIFSPNPGEATELATSGALKPVE